MIIVCPKCSSKFKVDDSLLQKKGIRMRCSVCSNIFTLEKELPDLLEPESGKPETEDIQKKQNGYDEKFESAPLDTGLTFSGDKHRVVEQATAEKPVVDRKTKPRSLRNTLTGLFVMIIITIALILSYSKTGRLKIFDGIGDKSSRQEVVYPFSIKDTDTSFRYFNIGENGQILVIKGIVIKNENKPLKSLQVEIRIYAKDGRMLAAKTVYAGKVPLDTDFLLKNEPEIDAILTDGSSSLGVLSQVNEIPFSVAFYGQPVLSTSSIHAEVKEYIWQ